MYIAFKWLLAQALMLWVALCWLDSYLQHLSPPEKELPKTVVSDLIPRTLPYTVPNMTMNKNTDSNPIENTIQLDEGQIVDEVSLLNYCLFCTALILFLGFKKELLQYSKKKFDQFNATKVISRIENQTLLHLEQIKIYLNNTKQKLLKYSTNTLNTREDYRQSKHSIENKTLQKKLKEVKEDRQALNRLLVAAMHENKHVKKEYQLETMAKNKLLRHVQNSEQVIKENKLRFMNFQNIYWGTYQENTYLKSEIRKLAKKKYLVEKNLMNLMREVFQTKDSKLKSFCSHMIVQTKDNLLTTNVSNEIQKFLAQSRARSRGTSTFDYEDENVKCWSTGTSPRGQSHTVLNNNDGRKLEAGSLVSLRYDEDHRHGKYFWDLSNLNKKPELVNDNEETHMFEFDSPNDISEIESYSTISAIETSFDHTRFNFIEDNYSNKTTSMTRFASSSLERYPSRQRFLTGSDAFQKFLQNHKRSIAPPRKHTPPFLCG